MENFKDCAITNTNLPTYLLELLQAEEDIILLQYKKKSGEPSISLIGTTDMSLNNTMNLTGSPLEVDLNTLPSGVAHHLSGNQSSDEAQYIPMKLKTARKFLIDYKTNSKELVKKPKPIYCICDGTDDRHTVVLGSYQMGGIVVRTLVFVEDCVDESHLQSNINNLILEHIKNVGTNALKIETKVTSVYELYGYKLSNNCTPKDLENTGSVLIEGSWNSCEYNIPQYGATLEMMLQAIIGHQNSIMCPFFQELVFLQHCLNTLSNTEATLANATISSNTVDLNKKISDMLNEVNVVREPSVASNNLLDAIIENIQERSFTDKLWGVLKCCKKVSDLKMCLDQLFEIIMDTPMSLQILDEDKNTTIGIMINDIYIGKLNVPYLSLKQSLELLVDLGIQKLKKNYIAVIKSYDFTTGEQLVQEWNKIGSPLTESRRGTLVQVNLKQGCLQLQFLLSVHVMLEFLQLIEQNCCFSKDVSLRVLEHASNKYVADKTSVELFSMLEKKQLCDLVVPLTFADIKIIKDCDPIKWQLKMSSTERCSSVTTIFHYSKKCIFPATVYSCDADVSSGPVNKKFFVSRLERYQDKIF